MTVQLQRHTFTVNDYHRMAEAGILTEDDRVELISGEIVAMAPLGYRHMGHVNRLDRILRLRLGSRATVSVQNALRLDDHSEPQPDVTVLQYRADDYDSVMPMAQNAHLVIEVSDSSIANDRETKLPLYAKAGIPEVWIVDLNAHRIETYRDPTPYGYREPRYLYPGDTLSPAAFPDVTLKVDEVLG